MKISETISRRDLLKLPSQRTGAPESVFDSLRRIASFANKKKSDIAVAVATIAALELGSGQLQNNPEIADPSFSDQKNPLTQVDNSNTIIEKAKHLVFDKKGTLASPESVEQLVINYSTEDLRIIGNQIVGLSTFSDGTKHVITANLNQDFDTTTGKITLREKHLIKYYPSAITASASRPDTQIVVGRKGAGLDIGNYEFTEDGWQTSTFFEDDKGAKIDAQIPADNAFACISESNHYDPNAVTVAHFDLTTKTVTHNVVSGAGGGQGIATMTELSLVSPGVYQNYGLLGKSSGYAKFTHGVNGEQAELLNSQEGFAGFVARRPIQFIDKQNRNRLWILTPFTLGIPPNDPDLQIATVYDNINNVQTNSIQPKTSLYDDGAPLRSLDIFTAAADVSSDQGYLGTVAFKDNDVHVSHIEIISLSNPNDLDSRQLIPNDGDWPTLLSDKSMIDITYLQIVKKNGKTFLVASVQQSEWVYDPNTNTNNIEFRTGTILTRDITSGIDTTKMWKENVVVITPKPTPTATKTPNPTSTKTPIPTATPRSGQDITPIPVFKYRLNVPLVKNPN